LLAWLYVQDSAHLFVTTVTLAEVWHGFHCLPSGHSDHESIQRFISELPRRYRILNFDARGAAAWGELAAKAGEPLPLRDSFIAAIARSRGCQIVTRDVAPFQRMGCKVVAPWT
jgi:predicted nucleic acid-binding protein